MKSHAHGPERHERPPFRVPRECRKCRRQTSQQFIKRWVDRLETRWAQYRCRECDILDYKTLTVQGYGELQS